MSRLVKGIAKAQRLLALLQVLRRHRYPITGGAIAAELGVSVRTVYRDIAALQSQGATIEGESGLGYLLRPGYVLPPLMFTKEEIEALVLGSRWVAARGDAKLSAAAQDVLAKVGAQLPDELRRELDTSGLMVPPQRDPVGDTIDLAAVRRAIRSERKLALDYRSEQGDVTHRTIWPFGLGYFDRTRIIVAWCELRSGYRHFRADRVQSYQVMDDRYPQRRQVLLQEWQEKEIRS
ncbi:MAG TPA: YafY family protein [Opitutaceae bacterium]